MMVLALGAMHKAQADDDQDVRERLRIKTEEKVSIIGYSDWPPASGLEASAFMEVIAKRKDGTILEFYFMNMGKVKLPFTGSICDINYSVDDLKGPLGMGPPFREKNGKIVHSMHCWWNFIGKKWEPVTEGTFVIIPPPGQAKQGGHRPSAVLRRAAYSPASVAGWVERSDAHHFSIHLTGRRRAPHNLQGWP